MPENTPNTKIELNLPEIGEVSESYTGEMVKFKAPRLEVPEIRVSYKDNDDDSKVADKRKFIQYDPATKENTKLGKKIVIQILHHRQFLSAYKLGDSWWTPEISMGTKVASLMFSPKTDKATGKRPKTQFLMKGTIKKDGDLRTAYPDLGYRRMLYILHDGKLKKLCVKGASFSKFIDFTDALKGESSASVNIELHTTKEKEGTVIFYPVHFTIKDKVDMKVYQPVGKALADWFNACDEFVRKANAARAKQAANDRGDEYEEEPTESNKPVSNLPPAKKPVDDTTAADPNLFDEPEKVDPKDIPF